MAEVKTDTPACNGTDAVPNSKYHKTPISTLQEYCQKIGKTPQYDLTATEGRAHQPQFVFRCMVGDVTSTGQGGSKKLAKHAAAEAVLKALTAGLVPEGSSPYNGDVASDDGKLVAAGDKPDDVNPVGSLQELVVARGWRLPEYTLAHETGPAHKKEFIICCTVETFKEYGQGTAKKHAKRLAANNMYNTIVALPREAKESVTNQSREAKNKLMYHQLTNTVGEQFAQLTISGIENNDDPRQQLDDVAKECKFEVVYRTINTPTAHNKKQCLVEMNTFPRTVVHGCGDYMQDAYVHAAKNALHYLKCYADEFKEDRPLQ